MAIPRYLLVIRAAHDHHRPGEFFELDIHLTDRIREFQDEVIRLLF
jgi:hypothetical protein